MAHYLAEYETFKSKQELNNAVYLHIKRNSYDLNETDRELFKAIARYAVKFPGAAHLKAETLAGFIGKSVKTARRIVNKLAELGIVEKVATMRKVNGGKGANIIRILPITESNVQSSMSTREDAVKPCDAKAEERKIEKEPSYSIKQKTNTNILDTAKVDSSALESSLPREVYETLSKYFNAEDIYKYYGVLLRAKRKVNKDLLVEDCPKPFVDAIHSVVLKAKQGKVRNLANYFFTSFETAASEASRIIGSRNNPLFFDWLNEEEIVI